MYESELMRDVFVVEKDSNSPSSRASEVGVENYTRCFRVCFHDCKLINKDMF